MASPEEQNESTQPSAAKVIAAAAAVVAAGGLMALRMRPASFLFLAGATAAAYLARKRAAPRPPKPLQLMPPAPQPVPAPANVETWLAHQIEREKAAPIIDLPYDEPEPTHPPDLTKLSQLTEAERFDPSPFFAESLIDEPEAAPAPKAVESPPLTEAPPESVLAPKIDLRVLQALESTESAPTAAPSSGVNAAWLLGIEPLPSWDEPHAPITLDSSIQPLISMDDAPGASASVDSPAPPPPSYIPPLFQGSALPDEISLSPPLPEPPPFSEPAVTYPEPIFDQTTAIMAAPQPKPPSAAVAPPLPPPSVMLPVSHSLMSVIDQFLKTAPPPPAPFTNVDEIMPLEQHFTPPPAATPAASEIPAPASAEAAPVPFISTFLTAFSPVPSPVFEPSTAHSETDNTLTPRPRGLGGATTIVTRQPYGDPLSTQVTSLFPAAEETPPTPATQLPVLPPAPVVLPREQKARKTWRSWWRGD